jgi:rhodanese-related sulfurtransferase
MRVNRIYLFAVIAFIIGIPALSLCAHSLERETPAAAPPQSPNVEFMSAAALKAKVAQNQRVTIIDVRTTDSFTNSSQKIKGAVHVKLRRLRYRLDFAPLKSVPRDSEVVTYCACPNDELSIKAAEVLMGSGFKKVRVLKGGWVDWKKTNGPVESVSKGF